MGQTLQYGVTRAQESEPVNTHMICEETCKIGFFYDSVAAAHAAESAKYRRNTVSGGGGVLAHRPVCQARPDPKTDVRVLGSCPKTRKNKHFAAAWAVYAAVDRFRAANTMLVHVPPWKGGTFVSGFRKPLRLAMRRERCAVRMNP
jgi:hypothetical protein